MEVFLIDEASMLSLDELHVIDRMLRDITGNDVPFGGKIMVFGGDFRQTLPIIPRASDTMILETLISLRHSGLYSNVSNSLKILERHQTMMTSQPFFFV